MLCSAKYHQSGTEIWVKKKKKGWWIADTFRDTGYQHLQISAIKKQRKEDSCLHAWCSAYGIRTKFIFQQVICLNEKGKPTAAIRKATNKNPHHIHKRSKMNVTFNSQGSFLMFLLCLVKPCPKSHHRTNHEDRQQAKLQYASNTRLFLYSKTVIPKTPPRWQ